MASSSSRPSTSSSTCTPYPGPKPTKRPRSTNWTYEEVCILSAFVREHTNKLFGTSHKGTESFEEEKQQSWKMAAEHLRASGGQARDWQKIRKKWQDVSCDARKYYRECHQTGGGEKPAINKTLEAVLDALSPISKDGILGKTDGETFPEELLDQVAEAVSHTCTQNQVDDVEITTEDTCDLAPEPTKVRRTSSTSYAAAKPQVTNILDIEKERLAVERERLQIEKEKLEVLKELNANIRQLCRQNFPLSTINSAEL